MNRILISYFSHVGENYFEGKIMNIQKGNTEIVAEMIQAITGGDLFKIESIEEYPYNYQECINQAKLELQINHRPKLKNSIELSQFDMIFVGYPSWWGTMPMPVFSFLESIDLNGKRVIPFCTHEGSQMGNSEKDLKKICVGAILEKGLAIKGSNVLNSKGSIDEWLNILE